MKIEQIILVIVALAAIFFAVCWIFTLRAARNRSTTNIIQRPEVSTKKPDRVFECTLYGRQHRFAFTAGVQYDAMDEFDMNLAQLVEVTGRKRVEIDCYLATEMSKESGENYVFNVDDITPNEALLLKTAVVMAINLGNMREYEPTEVDVGLAELEKKKEVKSRARISFLQRLLGLGSQKRKPTTPRRA